MSESEDTGKYQVNNDKTVQGQIIGDNPIVHQHFYAAQDKATSSTKPQRIWNIPYLRNDYFTGRKEILTELHARFKANNATALSQRHAMSGLGGIGKTQIAVQYAYQHCDDYQAVLWARAESHEALTSSFVEIARLLNLPQKDGQDQTVIVQTVKRWLQDNHGWLLILDNADEPKIVREFLPTKCAGHILLTTRAQALGGLAQRIDVDTFTPEFGALFLLRRATLIDAKGAIDDAVQNDREMALKISEELGGLPLALDQAGAYIEEAGCRLQDYQQIYQQHRAKLLKERRGLVEDHPEPVATTWALSFAKVEEKKAAAAELLRFCAFLAPENIVVEMIAQGASHLGAQLEPIASDPYELNQAIEVLRAYSLVQRDPKTGALSIHRLVQAVLRDVMLDDETKLWAERTVLAVSKACPAVEFAMWTQWERYLPHVFECDKLFKQKNLMFLEVAHLLNNAGGYLCERARYAEAEGFYQHCLDIWQQSQECDTLGQSRSYRGLGNVYSEQGKYKEATEQYEESQRILDRQNLEHYPDLARCLNNLAICHKVQGNYERAEWLYQWSLALWEHSSQPEHPDMTETLNNLAVLYAELGQYGDARRLFERCWSIQERNLGPKHPKVAQSLSNLANVYTEQKRYEEAERLYLESKDIFEQCKHEERDHPHVAYPLNGLAILRQKQSEPGEAEKLFKKSQQIWEQNHPQVAYSFYNLAVLYREQGNYEDAERLFEKSLNIWDERLGRKHLHTRICAKNYIDLLLSRNKDAQAQKLKKRYPLYD